MVWEVQVGTITDGSIFGLSLAGVSPTSKERIISKNKNKIEIRRRAKGTVFSKVAFELTSSFHNFLFH